MKTLLLNLWAWIVAHPEAVGSALLTVLSVIAASIANGRAKGAPVTGFEKFVDHLAVRTRANASNAGWSLPVIGKSIFEAAMDATAPERETQTPPPPRESEPGYAESRVLAVIAAVSLVALVAIVSGCSAREQIRRSVEPLGLYEVQHPLHGSCHEVGVRAQSQTLNRELVVYGGVCVGTIDAGSMGDAGAVE